jgi:hypothetical protein
LKTTKGLVGGKFWLSANHSRHVKTNITYTGGDSLEEKYFPYFIIKFQLHAYYFSTPVVNARLSNKITAHTLARTTKIDNVNTACPFIFLIKQFWPMHTVN